MILLKDWNNPAYNLKQIFFFFFWNMEGCYKSKELYEQGYTIKTFFGNQKLSESQSLINDHQHIFQTKQLSLFLDLT